MLECTARLVASVSSLVMMLKLRLIVCTSALVIALNSTVFGKIKVSLVQWTPLADSYKVWVMVGPNVDVCLTYMNVHYESPTWGLTGENSEDITETIICCRKIMTSADYENDSITSVDSTLPQTSDQNVSSSSTVASTSSSIAPFVGTAAEEYEQAERHEPKWYGRSSGWEGRTYEESAAFCKQNHAGGFGALCPYDVVCPMGEL